MTKEEYNGYIIAGEKYMQGDKYKKFLSDYFCESIINILQIK